MPSGGGHSGGGHFGGSSFSGSRGGHFGGSRSSGVTAGVHRSWYSPRVMIFGGRTVYLGTGRASAISALGVLIIISIVATVIAGAIWSDSEDRLKTIQHDYAFYHAMAENAALDIDYQTLANVTGIERYEDGDKYCIFYTFETATGTKVEGYSFYVYSYTEATQLKNGRTVVLALDTIYANINTTTDSVPLDYKDKTLADDDEYAHYTGTRKVARPVTFAFIGISVALILAAVLVPLTAKKATQEQIAESKQNTTTNDSQSAPAGTWRCAYCGALNDNGKERCDGCGAMRQK